MALPREPAHDAHDPTVVFAAVFAVLLAIAEVAVDAATWVELDVAPLYALPLLLAAAANSRALLWGLLVAFSVATFVVYGMQSPPGAFALGDPLLVNRVLDVAALVLTAGLLHLWLRLLEERRAQGRKLAEQNRALEAANAELAAHEAELARQNATLDELRRMAEAASGRKTQLLRSVSHDIRSPVSAIGLIAEIMQRTVADPAHTAEVPRMAQRLRDNASSLLTLVSDMLDVAQIDSGRVELHVAELRLDELVAARAGALAPQAEAKGLELVVQAAGPVTVRSDRAKVDRIVTNLLSNAIKFTTSGRVSIAVGTSADGAVIEVRDTGPGISADDRERIFDEFVRAGAAGGAEATGWGMGLAICRRLAGLLGARLELDSEPGRGSAFRLRLPSAAMAGDDAGPSLDGMAGAPLARARHAPRRAHKEV